MRCVRRTSGLTAGRASRLRHRLGHQVVMRRQIANRIRVRRIARPHALTEKDWYDEKRTEGIGALEPFLEIKTTWHPAGV